MDCKIYLGSICIMLEDIGFEARENRHKFAPMTYYYHTACFYKKIFADIDYHWVVEIYLTLDKLHVDRWKRNKVGLFLVQGEVCLSLCNPKSITKVTDFVNETIEIANELC